LKQFVDIHSSMKQVFNSIMELEAHREFQSDLEQYKRCRGDPIQQVLSSMRTHTDSDATATEAGDDTQTYSS